MGTASDGVYLVSEGKVEEWNPILNEYFRRTQVNRACLLPGGEVAIGTILDGIFVVGSDGRLREQMNSRNGMQNNTVLGLLSDQEGNIWAALDREST